MADSGLFDVDGSSQAANAELAKRIHAMVHDADRRIGDARLQTGQLTFRTLVLVNGGAAVAVLTFLGSLATKIDMSEISPLATTLVWFAWGVAAAVGGMAAAYGVSLCETIIMRKVELIDEPPFVQWPKPPWRWRRISRVLQVASAILGAVSLALFVWGMFQTREAIRQVPKVPPAVVAVASSF